MLLTQPIISVSELDRLRRSWLLPEGQQRAARVVYTVSRVQRTDLRAGGARARPATAPPRL